jgi:hypothetical protein
MKTFGSFVLFVCGVLHAERHIVRVQAARLHHNRRAESTDLQRQSLKASGDALPAPLTTAQRESNRASMGFVWGMLKMKGRRYDETFCSYSKDNCSTVDGYPGKNSHSELKFEKVVNELPNIPSREVNGEIRRLGDLGYFIFNDLLWTKDWKTFPIGADIEDHRKHRPTADLLMGKDSPAWNRKMIRMAVKKFFRRRKTMTKADYSMFVTKLFHKILLDMDLTEIEVLDFEKYKAGSLKVSLFPRWLVGTLNSTFGLSWARKQRDLWLEKYEAAMERDTRGLLKLAELDPRDKRFLADLLLTSMTSAGGISVPTVLDVVLGIIYGGDSSPWKVEDRSLTNSNILQLVLEAVRRYPAVVGFPSWSPDQKNRYVLNLAMALRDPDAWDEPLEFKLRPLSEYHKEFGPGTKIGVAWAQQAVGKDGLTPDSRGCPGQELSVVIITEFLKMLMPMQQEWVVTDQPEGGIKINEGPCGADEFALTRQREPSQGSPRPQTHSQPQEPQPETDVDAANSMTSVYTGADVPIGAYTPKFQCPPECQECCVQHHKWYKFGSKDTKTFKCIMSADEVPNFHVLGRHCTKATLRRSDADHGKSKCEFTDAENDYKMHEQLGQCARSRAK